MADGPRPSLVSQTNMWKALGRDIKEFYDSFKAVTGEDWREETPSWSALEKFQEYLQSLVPRG